MQSRIIPFFTGYSPEPDTDVEAGDILFSQWLTIYMNQKRNEVRPNTYEGYCLYLKKHILPYFQNRRITLANITGQHLQNYYNRKISEGLSVNTLKKHHVIIRGALSEAYKKDIITSNPADKVTFPRKKKFHGNFYSKDEIYDLLNAIGNDPIRPAIILGLIYGLRRSEVLGLR